MRYEIGNMDRYFIATNKTVLENAAFFTCELDETINKEKLLAAMEKALEFHPLFKTQAVYDKRYYLETNDKPIILINSKEEDRPKNFGVSTNGYPWRVTYFENKFYFEWCHIITDGHGALDFVSEILNCYFDLEKRETPNEFPLELGLEHFYDKKAKPLGQIKQAKGFKKKSLPVISNGFKCQSHLLSIKTKDLMSVAKRYDTTPAALLAPLFSRAVRSRIPANVKNRNVACVILVDCRKPMNFQTMHNCILTKNITYTDRFDGLDLERQGTVYRGILDLYVDESTIKAEATSLIDGTDWLYKLRPLFLQKAIMKIAAKYIKDNMNNIYITYLGRTNFSDELNKHIKKIHFRSWPDTGYACMAVLDFNGTLYIDFCENYKDKEVLPSFIDISKQEGIEVKVEEEREFEQSSMRVK